MADVDIAGMRKKLLELREDLESLTATSEHSAKVVELDQSRVGRLSRMDAMQAQAMAQASGRRREVMLQKIAAALRRMDDDEYGFCQACDEPINPKRLDLDPTAVLCVACAEKAER